MEDAMDIYVSLGQDQARGETLRSGNSTDHESGTIIPEIVDKTEMKEDSKVIEEDKAVVSSRKADRSKKPKESAAKEAAKLKVTVPRPFSLATDNRMSQERRRRSVDLSPSKEKQAPTARIRRGSADLIIKQMPKVSKSGSCMNKAQGPSDASKARSKMESGNGLVANCMVTKRSLTIHNKYSQIPIKQGGDATGTSKLGTSPTFKALPLPSFYHRTDLDLKLDVASKAPCQARLPQREKPKKRDRNNGAKRLIKSTRRALDPSKETSLKSVVAAT